MVLWLGTWENYTGEAATKATGDEGNETRWLLGSLLLAGSIKLISESRQLAGPVRGINALLTKPESLERACRPTA